MPTFDVYDTVVLKNDPTLVGTIERTAKLSDGLDHSSLEDLLIVNYTDAPQSVLIDFVNSGVPPRGYALVVCADDAQGAFLASEDDLTLLSRSFNLGEVVKKIGQTSSMIGTVINYSHTYALEPVFSVAPNGGISSTFIPTESHQTPTCGPDCSSDGTGHHLIENVPAEEVTEVVSVLDGDLAVHDDWVGAIEESSFDIVLWLANDSIVVLKSPEDLHIPVRDPEKPLISLPEFDHLARPVVLSAFQGWSTIPAPRTPRLGSFVATTKETLSSGRWLKGEFSTGRWATMTGVSATPLEGIVIGAIPRTVSVRWVTPNPFTKKRIDEIQAPSHRQMVYRNITNFRNPSDLIPRETLKICDSDAYPTGRSSPDTSGTATTTRSAGSYQNLKPGDQVQFRDPTAAAVKYAGKKGTTHGAFRKLPNHDGWDLNALKVVSRAQKVVIQWQDGSETEHAANDLYRFSAFESALTPGQVVLHRAGLKQAPADPENPTDFVPGLALTDFNEMAFFERRHDLVPSKVGIVQAVDHEERVVKVRWFESPNVILLDAGEVIHPESWFGPISDTVQELSMYEIMTFPAFDKRLGDFVVLPPYTSFERLRRNLKNKSMDDALGWPSDLSPALDLDRLILRAKTCLQHSNELQAAAFAKDGGDGAWIGDVIGIALDGTLTVRVMGGETCRDMRIPVDAVIACIDFDDLAVENYAPEEELEEWWEDYVRDHDSRSPSPIARSIEYEGGARMDSDEDDEAWTSADEDLDGSQSAKSGSDGDGDVEMADASTQTAANSTNYSTGQTQGFSTSLHGGVPSEPPAAFDVLEIAPPADQFSVGQSPSTSTSFLKRIQKEHKTLVSSLPRGQIYVRTYESRLDLLRCLIIGPSDTPYEDAPFLVDLYLGAKFPDEPPVAHFHSWTSGLGRINPNLYEEGKICLSLLGTWPGKESGEGWSTDATILQLLVSLQGLVMVRNPFFNEAGFEGYEAEGAYKPEAAQYAEKAYVMARGFVKHALERPPVGLEDVLAWLYLPDGQNGDDPGQAQASKGEHRRGLLRKVLDCGASLIERSQEHRAAAAAAVADKADSAEVQLMDGAGKVGDPTKAFLRPLSKGAVVMLQRTLAELAEAAGSLQ